MARTQQGPSNAPAAGGTQQHFKPLVTIEEDVYTNPPPNNGAGPLWCYGSTCLVRTGDRVYVSGIETTAEEPYNNVRWTLHTRTAAGWQLQYRDSAPTREPAPLGINRAGELFVFANPTLGQPPAGTLGNPARPELQKFATHGPTLSPEIIIPPWRGSPRFTEHSYRGLGVDGERGELLLLNISGHAAQFWSFLDNKQIGLAQGDLPFPVTEEWGKPTALRLCYPEVAIANRAAHILAVSDIVEPIVAWREAKFRQTQQKWDYVFRRLYYAWTPNITEMPFSAWQEIANWEATAGHIDNLDIWLSPQGSAYLLWIERNLDPRLQAEFFPDTPMRTSLKCAVMHEGKMTGQITLVDVEGNDALLPTWGRLHATPDGRLFTFYCQQRNRGVEGDGPEVQNCLIEIFGDGSHSQPQLVPLQRPLLRFMSATERGGSPPAPEVDLLGVTATNQNTLRYVRISLSTSS